MKTSAATLFLALVFGAFCCVYSKENIHDTGLADSSSSSDSGPHMAKKRSLDDEASVLGSGAAFISGNSDVSDDSPLEKRSSLFRFGKRQFRYGKRQFRYGKRQGGSLFRFGKRNSLLRFGKRGGGGALFRFGRSGGDVPFNYPLSSYEGLSEADRTEILRVLLNVYLSSVEDLSEEDRPVEAKRDAPGFHWGSDE